MLKKIVLSFVFAFLFIDLSFAGFGADVKIGRVMGEVNNFDLYLINTGISDPNITTNRLFWYKDYDKSEYVNIGADIFCEYPVSRNAHIGLKAGYTGFINSEMLSSYYLSYYYEDSVSGDKLLKSSLLSKTQVKSDAYEIPIAIYYKERINRTFSFFTGAGISFLTNDWTVSYYENNNNISYTETNPRTDADTDDPSKIYQFTDNKTSSKAVPLFILGIEARVNRRFAFVFDVTFRYAGKTKYTADNGFEITRDFSGLGANLAFRYYIIP